MHRFVVAAAAAVLALPAVAAEPNTQLEFTLGGTGVVVAGAPGVVVPGGAISLGFERDRNVYLLGFGMTWNRSDQVVSTTVQPDGSIRSESVVFRGFGVTLAPGYRRYLGAFEDTVAPFLEGRAILGLAWNSPDFNSPRDSITSVVFGLSGAAGGEVRLHRNFALTGRVIASALASHRGGLFSQDSQGIAFGSDAGFLFRF